MKLRSYNWVTVKTENSTAIFKTLHHYIVLGRVFPQQINQTASTNTQVLRLISIKTCIRQIDRHTASWTCWVTVEALWISCLRLEIC